MKKSTPFALPMTALAVLSLATGCQTIQSRGHSSIFGGRGNTPSEGDVVQPGQTKTVEKVDALTSVPPAAVKPAPADNKDFVIPDNEAVAPKAVHASDLNAAVKHAAAPAAAPAIAPSNGAPALPKIVKTYKVAAGDTFSGIAQKHGLTTSELARVNNLKNINHLVVGQTISIPEASPKSVKLTGAASSVKAPADGSVHTVAAGEYIGKIAHQYGLKTGDVLRANNLTEESAKKIKVGQKLIIPAKTAANAFTPKATEDKVDVKGVLPSQASVVKPIASAPQAGSKPTVSVKPVTVVKPVVAQPVPQPVAQPVSPAVSEPEAKPVATEPATPAPAVESPKVEVPVLNVPEASAVAVPTIEVPRVQAAPAGESKTYVVQAGDDWEVVAALYDTTKLDLCTLNGLNPSDKLRPGQLIKVP